jgi:Fe-S oxidoreductase
MASRFSGSFAWVINAIQKSWVFRVLLQKKVGFDKRRTLPDYAGEPFYKWFLKNGDHQLHSSKKVVLFADTFLNYHEPQIGISAVELLNSCGYEVILANVGCCQRPKISHGFLKDAKAEGTKTAKGLEKYFDQGFKVVVCEPSCASALNDDLPDLIDDQDLAGKLKSDVVMIDVFLDNELKSGNLNVEFKAVADEIMIHGHCHQKALFGTNAAKNVFANTNTLIREIPSGCCGMAGSFGYEEEHYDISKKIGDEILFPTLNKVSEHTAVVANGFSCRHQIAHFTNSKPKHWVEVVRAVPKKN